MYLRLLGLAALCLQLVSCKGIADNFNPVLYPWEKDRENIEVPATAWLINCGSPDKAIYRFGQERFAPGVACEDGWLFQAFHLWEEPCEGENLPDYWLNPNYGTLPALEKAIVAAEAKLGPAGKRYFTLSLPAFSEDKDAFEYIDLVRDMIDRLAIPHLEFIGFNVDGDVPQRVQRYVDACHEGLWQRKADVAFDYSAIRDIMDQPGVKSMDGKFTLKDVPERQAALFKSMESAPEGPVVMDCGLNCLVQLSRSAYKDDIDLLQSIYKFIQKRNAQ